MAANIPSLYSKQRPSLHRVAIVDSPPLTPATSWGMGHAELNLDPARTPGGFVNARQQQQQLSPPSIHISPDSVHAQMLTDPSRTPQTTPTQPKDALVNPANDLVNVNGFEEMSVAAAMSKHIPNGRMVAETGSGSDDDDDDDDDDSTTTSWSEEESAHEGWSDRAWSEDDRVSF